MYRYIDFKQHHQGYHTTKEKVEECALLSFPFLLEKIFLFEVRRSTCAILIASAVCWANVTTLFCNFVIHAPNAFDELFAARVDSAVVVPKCGRRDVPSGPDHSPDALCKGGVGIRAVQFRADGQGGFVVGGVGSTLVNEAVRIGPHAHFSSKKHVHFIARNAVRDVIPARGPPFRAPLRSCSEGGQRSEGETSADHLQR